MQTPCFKWYLIQLSVSRTAHMNHSAVIVVWGRNLHLESSDD